MKLVSPDISHKSDADGVQLDLRNENDIREAFARIMAGAKAHNPEARIDGISIQPFIAGADFELLLGSKTEEAYFVRCDRSTMTQNDLDNGRLVCLIGVAVIKPAEFVIFRIGQWTADARA